MITFEPRLGDVVAATVKIEPVVEAVLNNASCVPKPSCIERAAAEVVATVKKFVPRSEERPKPMLPPAWKVATGDVAPKKNTLNALLKLPLPAYVKQKLLRLLVLLATPWLKQLCCPAVRLGVSPSKVFSKAPITLFVTVR